MSMPKVGKKCDSSLRSSEEVMSVSRSSAKVLPARISSGSTSDFFGGPFDDSARAYNLHLKF